jgi:hypothetical protein
MNRKERKLIRGIDKRSRDAITEYQRQHSFATGIVKGLTLAGADVQLADSGRYLRNVKATRGTELVLGAEVLLSRIGRQRWVILGATESGGSTTQTVDSTTPAAGVVGLTAVSHPDHIELRWTASYFDIQCYEVMVNTAPSETGATTFVTDNTQFLYYADWGTYHLRVRAVGPQWDRGSWSAWTEQSIEHKWDLGSDPSWPYRLSFGYTDASWIELFAIGSNGTILFTKIAAPDDSEFEFSQFSFWFDDTPGATALHLKGKDSDATVVNHVISFVSPTFLEDPLSSVDWDGDTFSTTAKTLLDLSAVFGVPAGVKAVDVQLTIWDSGAGGADCKIYLSPNNDANIGKATSCPPVNNAPGRGSHTVPCNEDGDIYYQIAASGAGTFTAYMQIWGYWE